MFGVLFPLSFKRIFPLLAPLLALAGCSASQPPTKPTAPTAPVLFTPPPSLATPNAGPSEKLPPVMLGIDVLEAEGFAPLKGKRIGLLTHPAGVNRRGVSTIDVLRRAPGVKLVALFGPEHGVYGDFKAEVNFNDTLDRRTGLPMYAMYSAPMRRPTKAMLKGIDVLVIDLQDIGARSYTFTSAMKRAMEGCFENGVEVMVLDRPNPLGGLKVDGPLMDTQLLPSNYVGAFPVPYVHGLTIGELAKMAKDLRPPAGLEIKDGLRTRGKLTVIPMRGWTRSMRWPDTGLTWIATSGKIQDFATLQGYPMVGLGTYFDPKSKFDIGFRHGVGTTYDFRGLSHVTVKSEIVERELRSLGLPGLQFRRVSAPERDGKPGTGVYVEITDFDAWRPVELNFYLMKLACKFDARNPFLPAPGRDLSGFRRHLGCDEFLAALQKEGARIDLGPWLRKWREQDAIYQQQSRKYWLYR